jgi:hypothetical protein
VPDTQLLVKVDSTAFLSQAKHAYTDTLSPSPSEDNPEDGSACSTPLAPSQKKNKKKSPDKKKKIANHK